MVLKLYRTTRATLREADGQHFELGDPDWDDLVNRRDLADWLAGQQGSLPPVDAPPSPDDLLPPSDCPPLQGIRVYVRLLSSTRPAFLSL